MVAVLLVFLLWAINRGRIDPRFSLWILGWSFVLVHFLSLLWQPAGSFAHLLRQAHVATLEIVAGVCFILSEPALVTRRTRLIRAAVLGIVPTVSTVALILFWPGHLWILYFSIVITHAATLRLVQRHFGLRSWKGGTLATVMFLGASWMLGSLAVHRPELILASIPAEIFLINAVLFGTNCKVRTVGCWTCVVGFSLWAFSSFVTVALGHLNESALLLPSFLHLPEFLVAIGMTMIAQEEDTKSARDLAHEYETLFATNPGAAWIYDRRTLRILHANESCAKMHQYPLDELRLRKVSDLSPPSGVVTAALSGLPPQGGLRSIHVKKDGTRFPISMTSYDITFQGRDARMEIGIDLTERELMFTQLVYQLEHDLLTGLPNRRKLLPKLDVMVNTARERVSSCAVMVLQIERFEKINENYGYLAGDGLLKAIADRLRSELRPVDCIGRTGGREFTIGISLAPNHEYIAAKASKLIELFADPIVVDGLSMEVSVTLGYAIFPEDSDDAKSLWRDATRAQARARRSGGLLPWRLSRVLSQQEQEENRVEAIMRSALTTGGFEVFYQPIFDASRQICGLEALLRLRENDGAMISPALFIPIAESTGLIAPLGLWVLRQVCRQLKSWRLSGYEAVPVAVNISALQIVLPTICAEVEIALEEFEVSPSLLHFELTESGAMREDLLALTNMNALSALGIKFSIDDFGTGFSSLNRLHQMPVSVLKIDRAFVCSMLDANGTLPIVDTILSMAHSLALSVVAEGVETEAQLQLLREMGCDQFQGFLLGRPSCARDITAMLAPAHRDQPPALSSSAHSLQVDRLASIAH